MAASLGSSGGKRGGIVGINVTPFVDITLVLLIIMMVSATYIVSQSLKVELPKTANSDETVPKTFTVTVTKDAQYFFNDQPIAKAELASHLSGAKASGDNVSLVISADGLAHHADVVGVIDVAKTVGITKFAINVERSQ